jgi:ABC-type sugar transport system permease subunit
MFRYLILLLLQLRLYGLGLSIWNNRRRPGRRLMYAALFIVYAVAIYGLARAPRF